MYEKQIEKIPGFELTPEINIVKDAQVICEMAKVKLPLIIDDYFKNAKAIKKLLDDRRRLICILVELLEGHERKCRLDHHRNCQEHGYFSDIPGDCGIKDGFEIIKEVTGKTIDELLKTE